MSAPSPPSLDPETTRLGQLQRGRGDGFLRALRDGPAAVDDLLGCVVDDPRHDRQLEARGRYYAELLSALRAPAAPLFAALSGDDEARLGHEVLAGAFVLGHDEVRRALGARRCDEAVLRHVAECLVGERWARPVDLPDRLAAAAREVLLRDADCAAVASGLRRWPRPAGPLSGHDTRELLDLGRSSVRYHRDEVLRELVLRDTEDDRKLLAECLEQDLVFGRVRLAACALGMLGDERLVDLAERFFAREDVFEDPERRLSGFDRMRRSALAAYVAHLPELRQRALARQWHERGEYFATVAGRLFAESADGDDRARLEDYVRAQLDDGDGGWGFVSELDALSRLADAGSAPLLVEVVARATYGHARRRALHGLGLLASEAPAALPALRAALWDSEDEAAADACAFLPALDDEARGRVAALAAHALVDPELAARARRRLRRPGEVFSGPGDGSAGR